MLPCQASGTWKKASLGSWYNCALRCQGNNSVCYTTPLWRDSWENGHVVGQLLLVTVPFEADTREGSCSAGPGYGRATHVAKWCNQEASSMTPVHMCLSMSMCIFLLAIPCSRITGLWVIDCHDTLRSLKHQNIKLGMVVHCVK